MFTTPVHDHRRVKTPESEHWLIKTLASDHWTIQTPESDHRMIKTSDSDHWIIQITKKIISLSAPLSMNLSCDHWMMNSWLWPFDNQNSWIYSIPDFNCRMTMTYLIMQGRPFKLGGTSLRAWRCLSKHFSNLGGKSWREVPPSLEGRPSKLEELIFLNKNLLFFWKRSSILWS